MPNFKTSMLNYTGKSRVPTLTYFPIRKVIASFSPFVDHTFLRLILKIKFAHQKCVSKIQRNKSANIHRNIFFCSVIYFESGCNNFHLHKLIDV